MTLTKPQRKALLKLYQRTYDSVTQAYPCTYRAFRRSIHWGYECIMVPWCGMWVGIEKDGYAHT